MKEPFIVDAHLHVGLPGVFFAPETEAKELMKLMDRLSIRLAICSDNLSIFEGVGAGIYKLRHIFESSGRRIHYLGAFDPRYRDNSLKVLREAVSWPGFAGIKIHPSVHHTPADDSSYRVIWEFAAEHDLTILTHSWSISDYNPVQFLSTPERFERFVRKFPSVRLVLGHAGGRGSGRFEATRMAKEYENVYLDFSGDIFCYRLIESLIETVPENKILYGSDYPWLDPRAHISRVLLSDITDHQKKKILFENACFVYNLTMLD